ncbi:MAG TPA: wax ester/triacylglycerol synthase family O-acyltransferase [Kribbella sp.]|nr:wax ester/triacylglycerol synthase family O-acyltransferase [Kribbella sp.]
MDATTPDADPVPVERLTPLDVSNLRVEEHGLPMHVAALAILDARPLIDSTGRLRLDAIRTHVEQRTSQARRLRQVLVRPRLGLGPPLWVDDQGFAIERHIRTRALAAPGDEAALLAACGELNQVPLDRSRPLWELWLLTGLSGDRVGLLIRLHHVVADGIAAIALFGSLFDLEPTASVPSAPVDQPEPRPGDWFLFRSNLRDRRHAVRRMIAALGHPAGLASRVVVWARQAGALIRLGRAPAVSLNRPVGPNRRIMLARADLAATKAVAHRHNAKVNDVVLTAVAGGARRLLDSRGELTAELVLKVSVAASTRGAEQAGGNRVGIRVVPIPVGGSDPVLRLDQIATETASQRSRPPYQPAGRVLQRWMVGVMFHQRLVNLLLSNLPGPPAPLYFAGARMLEMFQVGVVQGNLALGVGVLSYAGQLNFDVVADTDAFPDLAVFLEGLTQTLDQLGVVRDISRRG